MASKECRKGCKACRACEQYRRRHPEQFSQTRKH